MLGLQIGLAKLNRGWCAMFRKHEAGACMAAFVFALLMIAAHPRAAQAQAVGGTITGAVRDPQSSIVPGSKVVALNVETGVSTTTTTNNGGVYRLTNLQPGLYEVTVMADGLNEAKATGIKLTVGAEIVADFSMQMAGVAESVDVIGEAAAVQLTSSTLSYEVSSTTMRELPLNGRDFAGLAALQPGVVTIGTQGGMRAGLGNKLSVSGSRPSHNNFLFDGVSINDSGNNTPGSILGVTLGVDAIDQFTLLSNTFSAEYGRASGGVINALTRSGTNQIKGSAFYFGRNSALDAKNFFDVPGREPKFRRHQFGASAGGPIKQDRTFWFANYEAVRQFLGKTNLSNVPSPALRQGTYVNPLNGQVQQYVVDPAVAKVLPLFPLPNAGITAPGNTGVFSTVLDEVAHEKYLLGRVDHQLTTIDSVHGSYFFDDGASEVPDAFLNKVTSTTSRRQTVGIEHTRMINSRAVNVVRFGFSRSVFQSGVVTDVLNPAIADPSLAFVPGLDIGTVAASGLTSLPAGPKALDYSFAFYNSFQGYENLYYTLGRHSMKFGMNVDRMQYNTSQPNLTGGSYTYGSLPGLITNGLQGTNPSITFAANLVGTDTSRGLRETYYGGYFQDDWRMMDQLTVNLGVRYEFVTNPTEVQHKIALLPNLFASAPRIGGPIFDQNPTTKTFSPRIGFALDPKGDGQTAIRAGFGIFDNLPLLYLFDTPLMRSFPYFNQGVLTNVTTPVLAGSFPNGGYNLISAGQLRTAYVDTAPGRAYNMQWNFNIQQRVGSWFATVGYVGSRGVHLVQVERNMNTVQPTRTAAGWFFLPTSQTQKLSPNFSSINTTDSWNGDSTYQGLQISVSHPFSAGLQVQGSYAFGKSIDDTSSTSSVTAGTGYPNAIGNPAPLFPEINRGLSDFDVKHNGTVSVVWVIPGMKAASGMLPALINGWQLSSVLRMSMGTPFTALLNSDQAGQSKADTTGAGLGQRPNRVSSDACASLTNPGSVNSYIKTQCFTFPTPVTVNGVTGTVLGNLARNALSAPGITNMDFSLIKNMKFSERVGAQLRIEMFNFLNHPNFSAPGFVLFDSTGSPIATAGKILSTTTAARQIQFGMKATF